MAHICSYAASIAAIAGAFCPKRFENANDTKSERLAATSAGCTIAARTASNSVTRAAAWVADRWAWAAAAASHPRYGATAAAIAADDGPSHDSPTRPDVTELKEAAAEANSIASWSQATAAADMGSDPAPPNMRAELISGGNVEKFMAPTFPGCTEFMAAHQPAVGERRVARHYSAIFAAVCISPE